jgi:hypothetical protein
MVKIDLGAHIDGHIVLAAHTVIVGADLSSPESAQAIATGRRAAVINATYTAAEVAAKMIKNGTYCAAVLLLLTLNRLRHVLLQPSHALKWRLFNGSNSEIAAPDVCAVHIHSVVNPSHTLHNLPLQATPTAR